MKYKIGWESWNAKEEEILLQRQQQHQSILNSLGDSLSEQMSDEYDDEEGQDSIIRIVSQPIHTPFGTLSSSSIFTPSERWECWLGHTNFRVTYNILNVLNNYPGVEALSILGAYTFCIGVPKMFEASEVRRNIEKTLIGDIDDNELGMGKGMEQ